jgi:hypothetical protein
LHLAAAGGWAAICEKLIGFGSLPGARNAARVTPFEVAAQALRREDKASEKDQAQAQVGWSFNLGLRCMKPSLILFSFIHLPSYLLN